MPLHHFYREKELYPTIPSAYTYPIPFHHANSRPLSNRKSTIQYAASIHARSTATHLPNPSSHVQNRGMLTHIPRSFKFSSRENDPRRRWTEDRKSQEDPIPVRFSPGRPVNQTSDAWHKKLNCAPAYPHCTPIS